VPNVLKVRPALWLLTSGAVAIALVPLTSWWFEHDRRNFLRASEPVATLQVGTLQEPTIRFTVPADRQWRGFVKRLGRPLFLLVVDAEPGTTHPLSTPVTNENLRVQGTRNDRPLIVTATGLRPFGYPSTNQSAAFKFDAVDGDVVRVAVHGASAPIPPDAFLMIFPLWNGVEMWHWGDSLSMGQGFFEFFIAPVLRVVGVVLILAALVVRFRFQRKT
jgi:hypothetical protein